MKFLKYVLNLQACVKAVLNLILHKAQRIQGLQGDVFQVCRFYIPKHKSLSKIRICFLPCKPENLKEE